MPFESPLDTRRRIAVIGGGISGMAAAWLLAPEDHVTLIEAAPRLGGHARTVLAGKTGEQPVDTGFIVFNRANYPHLTAMFEALDVPVAPSDMGFGASFDGGRCEYSLKDLNTLFASRRNIVDPRFLRMLRDILTFNARASTMEINPSMTIGDLMDTLNMGRWFRERYITPFSGAIWSTPTDKIMEFPAKPMVEFFKNHHLLQTHGQHQWFTVKGGSIQYVQRLTSDLEAKGVAIRTNAPVAGVRRVAGGVEVRMKGGEWEWFDEVVLAVHSDQALSLLSDPTPIEKGALSNFRYQDNHAVLHADASIMPRRKSVWSSWTYTERTPEDRKKISLSYWMNALQPIPQDDLMIVTLNATQPIRDELIYDTHTFSHPVYDHAAFRAQEQIRTTNGAHATWFCGAWMRNGFHEDGFASAVDVVTALKASRQTERAA